MQHGRLSGVYNCTLSKMQHCVQGCLQGGAQALSRLSLQGRIHAAMHQGAAAAMSVSAGTKVPQCSQKVVSEFPHHQVPVNSPGEVHHSAGDQDQEPVPDHQCAQVHKCAPSAVHQCLQPDLFSNSQAGVLQSSIRWLSKCWQNYPHHNLPGPNCGAVLQCAPHSVPQGSHSGLHISAKHPLHFSAKRELLQYSN